MLACGKGAEESFDLDIKWKHMQVLAVAVGFEV